MTVQHNVHVPRVVRAVISHMKFAEFDEQRDDELRSFFQHFAEVIKYQQIDSYFRGNEGERQ